MCLKHLNTNVVLYTYTIYIYYYFIHVKRLELRVLFFFFRESCIIILWRMVPNECMCKTNDRSIPARDNGFYIIILYILRGRLQFILTASSVFNRVMGSVRRAVETVEAVSGQEPVVSGRLRLDRFLRVSRPIRFPVRSDDGRGGERPFDGRQAPSHR